MITKTMDAGHCSKTWWISNSNLSVISYTRPIFVTLFIFCLAATAFLAQNKFDILSYVKISSTSTNYPPWQDSAVWMKLSSTPRSSSNQCQISSCPSPTTEANNGGKQPTHDKLPLSTEACPFYFRYIHEDLAPWAARTSPIDNDHQHLGNNTDVVKVGGVTKDMINSGRDMANFRLVIKNGRVYVDGYKPCFQTRAVFTIWSIHQLLRLYPGLIPDVDLLFGCGDTPRVLRNAFKDKSPPPVFRYCTTPQHFDIPFPDWSFWGWPEVDLQTWEKELCGILHGENELLWERRAPTAFWKGNTGTGSRVRKRLLRCNGPKYGAEIIHQNWGQAAKAHYKNSRLSHQCRNRYKIYAEGWGWSVSLKYIMGCDSPVLMIDPVYYDFFSRGMMPLKHYWPIQATESMCDFIKYAVDWGNNNTIEAEALGRSGRQYITTEVSMKHVYEYMLHLLREYAKLLQFEPTEEGMTEICLESVLCQGTEKERLLFEESMVKQASSEAPCSMPPRDENVMQSWVQHKVNITQKVHQAEINASPPTVIHDAMTSQLN